MRRAALVFFCGVLAVLPSVAATASEEKTIRAIVGAPSGAAAPGCAVGVFQHDHTLFVAAGLADVASGRAADADTLYYSGSLAKQFTALAIVRLAVARKLRLDDDIRTFLPEMSKPGGRITVAMLLHHTAGIPNSARLAPLAGYDHPSATTRAGALKMLFQYPQTNFPADATFEYSNGGYDLLAEIVERVSKTPFEDYIERSILRPLGMARSSVMRGALQTDANIAHGYMPKHDGFALSEDLPMYGGPGGMMLSINDLARYHHDIAIGHKIWTPAVTRMMTQGARYPDGSPVILPVKGYHFGYAAGLMLSRDWVLHGGNFAGFQALLAWRPRSADGIALLCNRGDLQPPKLATKILAALRPELPPVDAERYVLPEPAGRFVSDDIPALYTLTASGADLTVAVAAPTGEPRSTSVFVRTAERVYANGALTLTFDPDQRGFVVSNGSNTVRFHRE